MADSSLGNNSTKIRDPKVAAIVSNAKQMRNLFVCVAVILLIPNFLFVDFPSMIGVGLGLALGMVAQSGRVITLAKYIEDNNV